MLSRIVLQTFSDNTYGVIDALNSTIYTQCHYGEVTKKTYVCYYPDHSTVKVDVKCDGNNIMLILMYSNHNNID